MRSVNYVKKIVVCISIASAILIVLFLGYKVFVELNEPKGKVNQLYLYGDMSNMYDKKDVRLIEAKFMQGKQETSCYATIKVQGTSSLSYDKKNYTIKFYEDSSNETEKNINLLWGPENEYCLKANWIDKTQSRNVVTAKLASEVQNKYNIMEQAPCNGLIDGFPVELYINDQFHGLYTWNIPKAAWMFGMDENNPNHIVMCGENWEKAALFYETPNYDSWSVEAGPENEQTLEKFTRLSSFIMNSSDEEFREEFEEYINLDAALNYYILVDFAYLPDNCGKNMLVVTYDGDIWYPSLYDLDTSWGTDWKGLDLYDYAVEPIKFGEVNNLARRMEISFSEELSERYFELRKDILTKEHVLSLFEKFDSQISEEAKIREIENWGEQIPGYDISQIEDYLNQVIGRLDEKYENLVKY